MPYKNQGGFVNRLLADPFLNVGLGLLSQSGPSLTPVNPWAGVQRGLLASAQARAFQQEALQRQMEMEQAQALRQAQMKNYLHEQGIAERAQSLDEKRFENESNQPPTYSEPFITDVNGKPTLVQKAANGKVVPVGGGGPTVNLLQNYEQEVLGDDSVNWGRLLPDGSIERASPGMTRRDAENAGYLPLSTADKKREEPSAEQRAAESKRGQRQAENEAALEKGRNIFQAYMSAAKEYQDGGLPFGTLDKQAEISRKNLVSWYAKNILGTPGAEPSPALYEQAENIIPKFSGPINSTRFPAAMEEIQNAINAALDKDYKPRRADGSPPQGVDPEVWAEMTPQEKAAFDESVGSTQ